jgi:pimeloyl-ACP methyl ester carboxylesterase
MENKLKNPIKRLLRIAISIIALMVAALMGARFTVAIPQGNCTILENRLKGLEASRARLQSDLQMASGADKQSLIQQIKELDSEIREKQREFDLCVARLPKINHYEVSPNQTDPKITNPNRAHEVFVNADGSGDLLFMFFPGSPQQPSQFKKVLMTAAEAGYHVIGVDYPNPEELKKICDDRPNCYGQERQEVLEGKNVSPDVDVDAANCILNRAVKLIEWLAANHPNEHWGQFLNNGQIRWNKITVAGHSQGGGHAAMIARLFEVHRVVLFSSVSDATQSSSGFVSAPWLAQSHATPINRYYGFGNTRDKLFFPQIEVNWNTLALPGTEISVDGSSPPYAGSHRLTTTNGSQHPHPVYPHNLVATDADTPLDQNGRPVYLPVWRYLIGP